MATKCFRCDGHLPLKIRKKCLRWDYCEACQKIVNERYTIPAPPPPPYRDLVCYICGKHVPKRMVTEKALRFGKGLCSKKCSKEMYRTWDCNIPNSIGIKQFKPKDYSKKSSLKRKMIDGELKKR